MAKKPFETFVSTTIPSKHSVKEVDVKQLDRAYIIVPKNKNLFLKIALKWQPNFSKRNKKYIAMFYFQKGSAVAQAKKYNEMFGDNLFVAKEIKFTDQDQITLKTLC